MFNLFRTRKEQHNCILMSLLIFMTVVGYNVMRGMKETVLLGLSGASAAAFIPFVKIFLVMPISVVLGLFYLYVRHTSGISRSYYITSGVFLSYFALFTFHIVPNMSFYTPDPQWIAAMQSQYPAAKYLLGLYGNLPSAIYYVFAELWGTFTLVIMFWSMANDIFKTEEASRVYPILSLFSSFSIIASSYIIKTLSHTSNPLEQSTLVILGLGLGMILTVYTLNPCTQAPGQDASKHNPAKKKKKKMPLLQSIRTAIQTPHVLYLAICVLSFSILINIIETSLKEKLYFYYDTRSAYLSYYSYFTFYKGSLSLLANLGGVYLLRRYGWFAIAMITPILCIFTVNTFIAHNAGLLPTYLLDSLQLLDSNYTMMWVAVYGMIATYAAKYAFFDTTQQMAWIPLPEDIRTSGKAAADGMGGRMGKSGSGAILSGLLAITAVESSTNDMLTIAPYLIVITALISTLWLWSMMKLSVSYYSELSAAEGRDVAMTGVQQVSESEEEQDDNILTPDMTQDTKPTAEPAGA